MDIFRKVYNTHSPHKETAEFELSLLNHRKGEPCRLDQVHLITSVNRSENISDTKMIIWYMPVYHSICKINISNNILIYVKQIHLVWNYLFTYYA
jgi:hypothetical protein